MHWSLRTQQEESKSGTLLTIYHNFFSLFLFGLLNYSIIWFQFQICWIWQKVNAEEDKGFQRFLDNVQYKSSGILRYERIFGQGFVSTGGIGNYQIDLFPFPFPSPSPFPFHLNSEVLPNV